MICRPHAGGWLFISQPAHAWMAGELAAAWGNARFATPSPKEGVVLATRLHDIGWLSWDAQPRLENDGLPVNFLATTLDETLPIWRLAVKWVQMMNPFAALLVSMHASTIYDLRLERGSDQPEKRAEVQNALQEHKRLQAKLRQDLAQSSLYSKAIEPERLNFTYRWLRVCDLMSLAVLAGVFAPDGQIEQVPARAESELTTIDYRRHDPFTLEITPWPFARSDIQLSVLARAVDQKRFEDQEAYHVALAQAAWQPLPVTLRQLS